MSDYVIVNGELYHYGVKGMKWGKRKKVDYSKRLARGHAGPGIYATRKRQLARDKQDLEDLNNGKHLSIGLTKKRQAAYDARDKAALEKRIARNENRDKIEKARDKFREARKDVSASRTVGAKIATNLWAGPFANRTYNSVLAAGGTRAGALGVTTATALLGGPIGHLVVSHIITAQAGDGDTVKKYN